MSQSGDHLKSGQLGTPDVTASTVANIGPGIDFYFGFGVIAATAGVAAPLTILAADRRRRPAGFHGGRVHQGGAVGGELHHLRRDRAGARAGVVTALLVTVGYTVAIAAVFTMSGGLVAMTLAQFTSWHPCPGGR